MGINHVDIQAPNFSTRSSGGQEIYKDLTPELSQNINTTTYSQQTELEQRVWMDTEVSGDFIEQAA